jgi:penicillin-binding protein 1A
MRGFLWSTPRRRVGVVAAALVVVAAAVAAAAWTASPTPARLDARVAAHLAGTTGRPVSLSAVAPILRHAVVATEDERFYQHHGVDLLGALRALPYDLVHLSLAQGASTITEQVAKVLYLGGNDHLPWRKLEDAAVALKLEGRYDKERILAAYLNSAYFGEGAYGIRAASERYFALSPARLDTAQASLLAGLIQAPTLYDPFRNPKLARARQVEVLRSLVRNGFLTAEEASSVARRPLPLRGGSGLPPIRGVDFAPGPAFVWWELAAGGAVVLLGAAALMASRLPRFRTIHGLIAIRAACLVLALLGAAAVVRSFRSA